MNLDWSVIWVHRAELLEGVGLTILLTVLTMVFAIPGGILLAVMRLSSLGDIVLAATSFVEFFRNLPLILVVYWAFYVMPVLFGIEFSPFGTGLIALCLNVSAYNSETFRAGINSIRRGQFEAGTALGLSRWQLPLHLRHVLGCQSGLQQMPVEIRHALVIDLPLGLMLFAR